MTDSGASIIEKLDNADLRRALHTKIELIINLRLDINELKKDAERYRWLRNDKRGRMLSVSSLEWTGNPELSDAAIDAAMKERGE